MHEPEKLLNIACSVKARPRTVIYTRSNRDEILHFSILGGQDRNYGIFVSNVESNSQAEKVGLKRGDQILEVNGHNFRQIPHQKALEVLRSSTHLSITVKSNLLGFKEMLSMPEKGDRYPPNARKKRSEVVRVPLPMSQQEKRPPYSQSHREGSGPPSPISKEQQKPFNKVTDLFRRVTGGRSGSTSALPASEDMPDCVPHSMTFDPNPSDIFTANGHTRNHYQHSNGHHIKPSYSNPDLTVSVNAAAVAAAAAVTTGHFPMPGGISQYYQPAKSSEPEHVLKIYRADQSFKYLTVYKETTAQNVVQLALQEFGMSHEPSTEYALYEVSVTAAGEKNLIRQRLLQEQTSNLAERIGLSCRYYLKCKRTSDPLLSDELAADVVRDSDMNLLQLHPDILTMQLTFQDFHLYKAIEPTEYVDQLFKLNSTYGWPRLKEFDANFNREMFWVVTEILRERNLSKRAKLVKKFIKIAKYCKDWNNYNSMFAVLSGLSKPAIDRLHATWEKVPSKYKNLLQVSAKFFYNFEY